VYAPDRTWRPRDRQDAAGRRLYGRRRPRFERRRDDRGHGHGHEHDHERERDRNRRRIRQRSDLEDAGADSDVRGDAGTDADVRRFDYARPGDTLYVGSETGVLYALVPDGIER
jgi:hypothetical protein